MHELFEKQTLLRNYYGIPACEWSMELKRIPTLDAIIQNVENHVLKLVETRPIVKSIVADIANDIIEKQGLVIISEYAKRYNISSRHLESQFKQKVGITPGKLAKVSRFFNIINAIMQKKGDVGEIIQRFEYYDRHHFIKDFKAFTSKTPSEFFASVPEVFTKYAEQYRASLPDNKSKDFLDN